MGNEYLEILSDAFVVITEKNISASKPYVRKPLSYWEAIVGNMPSVFAASLLCKWTVALPLVKNVLCVTNVFLISLLNFFLNFKKENPACSRSGSVVGKNDRNCCVKEDLRVMCCSRDHKAVGRRPFDKMATLLAYLGPPEHKPVADTHWSSLNLTSSKFEEFMTR